MSTSAPSTERLDGQQPGATHVSDPTTRDSGILRSLTIGKLWWVGTLAGYLVTRLVAVVGIAYASRSGAEWPAQWGHPPSMSTWDLMTQAWDARWYTMIIEGGYPSELPLDENGNVAQNPWAFYPIFPMTVRLFSTAFHLPTDVAGILVVTLAGLAAVLLLRQLLLTVNPDLGTERPWFLFAAPLALAAFPSAGVFSTIYSDAFGLVFVIAALALLIKRRYFWFCVMVLLVGLARPLAVPLGIVVIVHFWPLVVRRWRREHVIAWRDLAWFTTIGFVCVLSVALWPTIAAVVTGQSDALFATQAAWTRPGDSDPSRPFSVWFTLMGGFPMGILALVLFLGPFLIAFRVDGVRQLGREIYAWSAGYLVFLVATVSVSASTPRYLLAALSLHLFLTTQVRKGWHVILILTVLLSFQFFWVFSFYKAPILTP